MALKKDLSINIVYGIIDASNTSNIAEFIGLENTVLTKSFELKEAYIMVSNVDGCKNNMCITVDVYNSTKEIVLKKEKYYFIPDLNGGNFIKQAYDHLKILPEYNDAIDVLEEGQTL